MAEHEVEFHEEDFGDHFGQPPTSNNQQGSGQNSAGLHAGTDDFFTSDQVQGGDEHHQHHDQHAAFAGNFQNNQEFFQEQQAEIGVVPDDQFDDFYASQAKAQQGGNVQFGQMPQGGMGMGQGMNAFNPDYDPEEEERQDRLRRLEHQRIEMLEEKARVEREKKQEKIADAARELAQWHSTNREREQAIEKRKQINRQNQQIQDENNANEEYKNSWDKVVANIAVKEGEYPGTKDVTRFRQSLVNKKADASKGVDQKIAEY